MGSLHQTQLWIATQVSVIKVKVTVTKNRNSVATSILVLPEKRESPQEA